MNCTPGPSRTREWMMRCANYLAYILIAAALDGSTGHGDTRRAAAESNLTAVTPKPPHQEVLAGLTTGDSVRPVVPPLHPVAMVYNREAIVPPQCYTRTEGRYNPCYV